MSVPTGAVLEVLKSFIAEHPELVPELVKAAEPAVEKVPVTIHDLFHDLVDHVRGIDPERAGQYHAVIDEHAAQHAQLVSGLPAASPAPAEPEVTPAGSEPPAPAPAPVPENLVVSSSPATPAS